MVSLSLLSTGKLCYHNHYHRGLSRLQQVGVCSRFWPSGGVTQPATDTCNSTTVSHMKPALHFSLSSLTSSELSPEAMRPSKRTTCIPKYQPEKQVQDNYSEKVRVSEGFMFCLFEGQNVFCVLKFWIEWTTQNCGKRSWVVECPLLWTETDLSRAVTFPFCEGSGSSVLLALLQPGAIDWGLQALTGRGKCPVLPSSLPYSPLDQQELGISSNPSALERKEGTSLGGGITEEGGCWGEERENGRERVKEEMITLKSCLSLQKGDLFIIGSHCFSI